MSAIVADQEGSVRWLRLNRPDARNGIDASMRDELSVALAEADRDRDIRAIVVAGTGPDFCVGADLAATNGTVPDNPLDYRAPMLPYQDLFRQLWELETPVVSAVRGRVAGIGWLLALLADLVVASDTAKWTHVFTRRGMAPHAGDPFFLPRILPFHVLNEIALLGDTITSADLHRWGAVNRLVADGAVDKTAGELAGRLAAGPTLSLGQARRLYRRSLVSDMTTAFAEEAAATAMLSATRDRAEGTAALMEGRRPKFTGHLSRTDRGDSRPSRAFSSTTRLESMPLSSDLSSECPYLLLEVGLLDRPLLRVQLKRHRFPRLVVARRRPQRLLCVPHQIRRTRSGPPGKPHRGGEHLVVGRAPPGETVSHRLRTGQRVAEQHERGSALRADSPREPPQVPAARVDSHIEEARVEAGALAGDHDVAGERQVHPGADGGPRDGRDRRDRRVGEGEEAGIGLTKRMSSP